MDKIKFTPNRKTVAAGISFSQKVEKLFKSMMLNGAAAKGNLLFQGKITCSKSYIHCGTHYHIRLVKF